MLIRRPQDIGALVKSTRTAKGLNQQQLADRLGVSRLWVNELEGGKATSRLDLVLRALNELGITLTATSEETNLPEHQASARQLPPIDIDAIAETGLDQSDAKGGRPPKRRRK